MGKIWQIYHFKRSLVLPAIFLAHHTFPIFLLTTHKDSYWIYFCFGIYLIEVQWEKIIPVNPVKGEVKDSELNVGWWVVGGGGGGLKSFSCQTQLWLC